MSTYRLNTKSKFEVPALLDEVGAFIKTQEHGSLGSFDTFGPNSIPKELVDEKAVKNGFSFIELADGSLVALLNVGAVVLLESEGNHRTLANSLEEFLLLWSKGESDVPDLDEGEGLDAFAKWVKAKKLKAPKAKNFDFNAWLDGGEREAPGLAGQQRKPKQFLHERAFRERACRGRGSRCRPARWHAPTWPRRSSPARPAARRWRRLGGGRRATRQSRARPGSRRGAAGTSAA